MPGIVLRPGQRSHSEKPGVHHTAVLHHGAKLCPLQSLEEPRALPLALCAAQLSSLVTLALFLLFLHFYSLILTFLSLLLTEDKLSELGRENKSHLRSIPCLPES